MSSVLIQIPLTHGIKARCFLCSGQCLRIKDAISIKEQERLLLHVAVLLGKDHSRGYTGEAEVVILLHT